mmetsp:Transcript_22058/g.54495  ORF Transcript_22058/g.54495 Transcript_22058/m.54495 type:complete len:82 (-) Transcript_22058:1070-1315(-)
MMRVDDKPWSLCLWDGRQLEYYNCSKCVEDDGSIPGSDPTKNECGLFARNKTKGIYISGRRRHHHQARKVTKNLQSNWEMT